MDKRGGEKVSLSEIEAGLERLMPRGLAEDARLEMEAVVVGLAAEAQVVNVVSADFRWPRRLFWAAAAVMMISAFGVGFLLLGEKSAPSLVLEKEEFSHEAGIQLVESRAWVERGSELDLQVVAENEEVSKGWSYSGVEEERLLHEDSGYEVLLQRSFETVLYASASSL